MLEDYIYKREYFRIDTFLPIKIDKVSKASSTTLIASLLEKEPNLKPMVINLSGGGMNFKTTDNFNGGDILEIKIKIPNLENIICVYGEVLRTEKTIHGFNRVFVKFVIISEKIREIIVNFVFLYERETIRNSLVYQYSSFVPISLDRLIEGTFIPFDIFINTDKGIKYLFPSGLPYDAFSKEFFLEKNISQIFILKEHFSIFTEYLEKLKTEAKVLDKTDNISFREYSFQKSQLHHINKALIIPKKEIMFSLYKLIDFKIAPIIEIVSNLPVVIYEDLKQEKGDILIKRVDFTEYLSYLATLNSPIELDNDVSRQIFFERGKIILRYFLLNPMNKDYLLKIMAFGRTLVDLLIKFKNDFYQFLISELEDFYTYTHSINVAILSIATGIVMNFSKKELESLAIASLLHDIGHNTISNEVIDKQGKLTDIEYEVFKTHVLKGVWILNKHKELSSDIIEAIAHHHEKLNGSGYPMGIVGKDISLFGRIIAITDTFDLLTTKRPYRNAYTSNYAFTILAKNKSCYDQKIFELFIKLLVKK